MKANYLSLPLSISWHFLPTAEHYVPSAIKERAGNVIIIHRHTLHCAHFLFIHSCVSLYKQHTGSNSLANCHQCPALGMHEVLSASIFRSLGPVDRPSLERTQAAWTLMHKRVKPVWLGFKFVTLFRHFRASSGSGTLPVTITIPRGVLHRGRIFRSIYLKHSVQLPASHLIQRTGF